LWMKRRSGITRSGNKDLPLPRPHLPCPWKDVQAISRTIPK
jgi:hypothetical protein